MFIRPRALRGPQGRATLRSGVDRPTTATTGVLPGVARTNYSVTGPITTAGTVLQNLNISGDFLKIRASGVVIDNCRIIGPLTDTGVQGRLVDCIGSAGVDTLITNCTIEPAVPTRLIDGITGNSYTAKWNYIRNTVDYFGVFNQADTTGPLDVVIEMNLGDGMHAESPDSSHSDNITHNDGVQIQAGTGPLLIQGNDIYAGYYFNGSFTTGSGGLSPTDRGTGDETNGRYQSNLGFCCIQFTNIGANFPQDGGPGAELQVFRNWLRGGNRAINAGSANNSNVGKWWGNQVDDDQGVRASLSRGGGHTLNMDATTTCDTGDGTANANRYMSSVPTVGGNEVTVRRNQ